MRTLFVSCVSLSINVYQAMSLVDVWVTPYKSCQHTMLRQYILPIIYSLKFLYSTIFFSKSIITTFLRKFWLLQTILVPVLIENNSRGIWDFTACFWQCKIIVQTIKNVTNWNHNCSNPKTIWNWNSTYS